MSITYRDLLAELKKFSEAQLDCAMILEMEEEIYSLDISTTENEALDEEEFPIPCFKLYEYREDSNEDSNEDLWEENPEYPRSDWAAEVQNDDTLLGYWEWVEHQKESNEV